MRDALLVIGALLLWSAPAGALVINLDSGPGWTLPSGDPAYAPYPNPITTPQDIIDNVPDKTTTSAQLMWQCAPDGSGCRNSSGTISGASGPVEASFQLDFIVPSGLKGLSGTIDIIADDFFELSLNGTAILSGLLEANLASDGQPIPLRVDLLDIAANLQPGLNSFMISANDGFQDNSTNRGLEYVFVDGRLVFVPEPASLGVFAVGLLGLVLMAQWCKTGRS